VARLSLIVVAALSSLAAGCCCPALSGRYYEVGLPPPSHSAGVTAKKDDVKCAPGTSAQFAGHHGGWQRHGWLGHRLNDAVPSQQQYDYVNPLPKFHPAPVQPVFETQMHYLPPSDPTAKPQSVLNGKP
jgi:hypothetical protein